MGLAISADGRTLYVSGGRGKTVHVIALDEAGPRVKSTIAEVGERPWGIGVTRSGDRLYTANGPAGDVTVIDAATGAIMRHIEVGGSPWGVAMQ
jgi:YVTN family beta-propeller protein